MNRILLEIADVLDKVDRQGSDEDSPEGVRYITLSDTYAKELAAQLRRIGSLLE